MTASVTLPRRSASIAALRSPARAFARPDAMHTFGGEGGEEADKGTARHRERKKERKKRVCV